MKNQGFFRIEQLEEVDSTNLYLKEKARQGEKEGLAVIARRQSAGRGRLGRSFFSPDQTGLYMSLLLRPHLPARQALMLTTQAAVAVCRAIRQRCGLNAGIKWVNDVLVEGKKVCGILTESQINPETGYLDWAVVGVGINLTAPEKGFPGEISSIAGALYPYGKAPEAIKEDLAGDILNAMAQWQKAPLGSHMQAYRNMCLTPGQNIWVLKGDSARPARAIRVEDDFSLMVEYPDGKRESLGSGEVSTRLEGAL